MEDNELIGKLKNPETRNFAFNQLVRMNQERVYWLVRKMVVDHDDAHDLVQETFIKAWRHIDNFRGDSKLFTWIYKIATNECLQYLEKKKRRFFLPINDVAKELTVKLDSSFSGDEIQLKLQKAILTLPDKQRLVFNMKYYEDLKYEEMSEILGTSVGALKASYHLAVKKIEDIMKKEFTIDE